MTEPKPALNWTSFLSPSVCPMPLPSGLLTPDPVSPNSQQTYPTVHSSFSITTFHKIHLLGFQGPCHALLEHGDTRLSSIPPFSPQPQSLQFWTQTGQSRPPDYRLNSHPKTSLPTPHSWIQPLPTTGEYLSLDTMVPPLGHISPFHGRKEWTEEYLWRIC